MISTIFMQEFCQLMVKHGASIQELTSMTYSQEELDPSTGNYKKYFDLTTIKRQDKEKYPKGITYKVRYKFDLSGKRIPQGKVTYTTKTAIFKTVNIHLFSFIFSALSSISLSVIISDLYLMQSYLHNSFSFEPSTRIYKHFLKILDIPIAIEKIVFPTPDSE